MHGVLEQHGNDNGAGHKNQGKQNVIHFAGAWLGRVRGGTGFFLFWASHEVNSFTGSYPDLRNKSKNYTINNLKRSVPDLLAR